MQQLWLFDEATPTNVRFSTDSESEKLISRYVEHRATEGASHRSLLREASQIRSVARECGWPKRPLPLSVMVTDLGSIARALSEPHTPVSQATGRARLVAVQRFLRIIGPAFAGDPSADLIALDALLPARRSAGWHTEGTLVAGGLGLRRPQGPTLDAADLLRIVDASGDSSGSERQMRDRGLVALQCFSGLSVEEVIRLRWNDIDANYTNAGYFGLTATVERAGRRHQLPMPGPSGEIIGVLREQTLNAAVSPSDPVFCRSGRGVKPLSYRGVRKILVAACRRAGLPPASSAELRAGFAHWLRSQGLSDHEVSVVLGVARVRTVDRLLKRHVALDAQRRVREQLVD